MHDLLRRTGTVAMAAALAFTAAACGDDETPAETGEPEPTTTTAVAEESTTTTAAADEPLPADAVQITGVDYAFEGVPDTVIPGTAITFTNASTAEAHELVAGLLPADETRSVDELVADPAALEQLFGTVAPSFVLLAGPGEDGVAVPDLGDGTLTEPGRYLLICTFPVGGDPAVVLDPTAEGPVESDAPPHFSEGMYAELTVE